MTSVNQTHTKIRNNERSMKLGVQSGLRHYMKISNLKATTNWYMTATTEGLILN